MLRIRSPPHGMYSTCPHRHIYSPPSFPRSEAGMLTFPDCSNRLPCPSAPNSVQPVGCTSRVQRVEGEWGYFPWPLLPGPLQSDCVRLRCSFRQGAPLHYWSIFELRKELSLLLSLQLPAVTCPGVLPHPLLLCLSLAFTFKKNPFNERSSINQIDYVTCFLPKCWLNTFSPNSWF